MIITSVEVYNFRSLKEKKIDLKPLTIFVGPNGAGKSSILYSIYWMYLKTFYNPSLTNPCSEKESKELNIESYKDLILGRNPKNWIGVTLTFSISDKIKNKLIPFLKAIDWEFLSLKKPSLNKLKYGFRFRINQRGDMDYEIYTALDSLELIFRNWCDPLEDLYKWSLKGSLKAEGEGKYSYSLFGSLNIRSRVAEYRSLADKESKELKKLDRLFEEVFKEVKNILNKIFLIKSTRGDIPLKAFAETRDYVGIRGEDTLNVLAKVFNAPYLKTRKELGGMLSKWAEKFEIKELVAGLDRDKIRATYKDLTTLDLALGSYGHKQLITFLAQLIASPPDSIIMIEEPEISLHAKSQMLLPLLFAEVDLST